MTLPPPLFTIIIPTYERPEKLKTCLLSLSCLDYPRDRFEVVIVDDGGESPLKDVVAAFADRLHLILVRQQNTGPAAARNAGAVHAKGEFLAFLDDDCEAAPDWLDALAKQFMMTPACIIGGRIINRLSDNPYSTTSQLVIDIVYRHYNANPYRARFFASNNLAIPSKHFREIGGFDSRFRTSEDRELCDRWLHHGFQMIFLPEAVIYHAHDLTFLQFCKQHFNYGRGAHRCHKVWTKRGSGSFRAEFRFHLNFRNWLFYPFSQVHGRQALSRAGLMLVWQMANAAGFLGEALHQAFQSPRTE